MDYTEIIEKFGYGQPGAPNHLKRNAKKRSALSRKDKVQLRAQRNPAGFIFAVLAKELREGSGEVDDG